MLAYSQYPQQYSSRHSAMNGQRPPYPPVTTQTPMYQPASTETYYGAPPNYPPNQLPPAHILQYLSPPLPQHCSPIPSLVSYPSSASSTSRHSAHSYTGSVSNPLSPYPDSPYTLPKSPAKSRAVVIGINYFNQKGELPRSCRDARNLFTYLTEIKGYSKRDIVLLTDDQNGVYGQPTRKNILDALSWVSENAERGEKVVIYYSGHGKVAAQGKKGKAKAKSGNGSGRGRHAEDTKESENNQGETIYPVDFRSFPRGMITPEELDEKLKPAQRRGVKLTVILDTHAAVA